MGTLVLRGAIALLAGTGLVGAGYVAHSGLSAPLAYVNENIMEKAPEWPRKLDTKAYDVELLKLADIPLQVVETTTSETGTTTTRQVRNPAITYATSTNVTVADNQWPVAAPYPHGGAILPFHRIVAYYGNFLSTRMGILGEFPEDVVLQRLASTTAMWEAADPDTPVVPAIHYIAMVAQADAGSDGMYRAAMSDEHIEKAYRMTREINGIMFIDLQVGLSNLKNELPQFKEYLARPEVHLAVDPEFAMEASGYAPGRAIGTFDAAELNFAINYLAQIVREYKLPPKVFVIHRFTQNMVTNYDKITPQPEVQVVMHMDGWGPKWMKRDTYRAVIEPEPVQFAGLKIFYKNDLKPPSTGILTPEEALELHPEPVYVQYQ